MGKELKGREGRSVANWMGLLYLVAVFLGCTTIILLPFFGLLGWVVLPELD